MTHSRVFFCFSSAFEESPRQPMYQNRVQHPKCNASTPTKPILHEKCDYHGKDEYSHVFYVSVWDVDISYCNNLDYMI